MQRICRPFVFQTIISAFQEEGFWGGAQSRRLRKPGLGRSYLRIFFQETLCPVTLAHEIFVFYSSLYFCTSNTFSPILARFSHILVYTNFFFYVYYTQNIFLIPDDAVARNLIIIFNFRSQRPHMNHIFLSNVYSFDTIQFCMKHKC